MLFLSPDQEVVLRELVEYCSSCGYPRKLFLKVLIETHGIERPLQHIKDLIDQEFVSFSGPNRRSKEGVFKPKKKAFDHFGIK